MTTADAKLTEYYARDAARYDALHVKAGDEHYVALQEASDLLGHLAPPRSILDIGCGTGRSLEYLGARFPEAALAGIDPSAELLAEAARKLPHAALTKGAGERLPYVDGGFDLVVASGVLHHVREPRRCIDEMVRVSSRAVLISDHNNFAFGSGLARRLRLGLHAAGLLRAFCFIKQGFRSQGYSADDGWWYPYSLLNDYGPLRRAAARLFVIPTRNVNTSATGNMLLCQSHLAILALKAEPDRVASDEASL